VVKVSTLVFWVERFASLGLKMEAVYSSETSCLYTSQHSVTTKKSNIDRFNYNHGRPCHGSGR
jgi:hypothetical protein